MPAVRSKDYGGTPTFTVRFHVLGVKTCPGVSHVPQTATPIFARAVLPHFFFFFFYFTLRLYRFIQYLLIYIVVLINRVFARPGNREIIGNFYPVTGIFLSNFLISKLKVFFVYFIGLILGWNREFCEKS